MSIVSSLLALLLNVRMCYSAILSPTGANVIITRYQVKYVSAGTSELRTTYDKTCTKTCDAHFLFCWSKKTVCKNVRREKWFKVYKRVSRRTPVYSCKYGWKQPENGVACTIPECYGCSGHGECDSPWKCKCRSGWKGQECRVDINECSLSSLNKCKYKPGCRNTRGSYRCTCPVGYFLQSDGRTCADIDECNRRTHTCSSKNGCRNTQGNYTCTCETGYYLDSDQRTCRDVDECSSYKNDCGFKGGCKNTIGSYTCSCLPGYYLDVDGRKCKDINECEKSHGCQQKCVNYPGGYSCACHNGYRRNTNDTKRCDDIDECAERKGGCSQNCTNKPGSFDCSCNAGYILGGDKISCIDFNECKSGLHSCQHICLNTIGSYKCKCKPGFKLSKDGKTCIGNLCRPIHTPANGNKTCSGYRNTDTCIFSCFAGYKQIGSDIRTCIVSRRWTGKETKCEPIHCLAPPKPKHGFIYSPCNTRFGSQCFAGCNNGYYKNGTAKITCSVKGTWEPTDITCHEIKACKPNPCKHDSRCTAVSFNQFSCNCSGTGWQGKTCERGVIIKPHFPALVAGVSTKSLEFRASPPDEYFILTPSSPFIQFNPPTLLFKKHASVQQSLTITARRPGPQFVRFNLGGPSATAYESLESILFFVQSRANAINNNGTELTFPSGRCKLELDKCPGSNLTIGAYSTSPWITGGITRGQISLRSGNIELPYSILGGNFASKKRTSSNPSCAMTSPYSPIELAGRKILAKSFLNAVRHSLPKWLEVKLHDNFPLNSTLETDLQTHYLSGKRLVEKAPMKGVPLSKHTFFSLLLSPDLDVAVHGDRVSFKMNDRSTRFAVALDLCSSYPNDVILRPSPSTADVLNELPVMKQLRGKGWRLKIESLQLSKKFFGKTATNRTLILYATFGKQLNASANNVKSRVDFEGTVFVNVDNLNNIMDFPLNQKWHVELRGDIILTLEFKVQGKMTRLAIEISKTQSYATFGGNNSQEGCLYRNSGLSIAKVLEKNPFLGTELSKFIELDQTTKMSCFLSARLCYENQDNSFKYHESSNGVNITFDGVLKFGALRFENLNMKLWVKDLHCSDASFNQHHRVATELCGNYGGNISTGKKLGIFEIPPGSVINLHVGQDSRAASGGSFSGVVNILGFKSAVNVNVSYNGLEFQAEGKIYGLFYMTAVFKSALSSWKDQRYIATGSFERNVAEKDFNRVLEKELTIYSKEILSKAQQRIHLSADTEKRARSRLRDVQNLRDEWLKKVKEIQQELNEIEVQLDLANKDLEKSNVLVKNYSNEIHLLNETLNELCTMKRCSKICQKGWSKSTCWTYIIAKKMERCWETCNDPIQKPEPPFQVKAICLQEHCSRIHSDYGAGAFLGTITGIFLSVVGVPIPVSAGIGAAVGAVTNSIIQGKWKCEFVKTPCTKPLFNYKYTNNPYRCERPCEKQNITNSINRSCSEMVDCASFVPNTSCITENAMCVKVRKKALEKISKVKADAARIVGSLDNAEQNVALLKMKRERVSIKLRATSTSLTMYQDAVQSLEKGYNVTMENHKRKLKILAKPLMLRNLLDELGESFVMVQNTTFRAKVSADYDTKLLPINVTVVLNGTHREEVHTVLDFRNLNRSLRIIAKEILGVYIGDVSLVRKKRSVKSTKFLNDHLPFYTLQTYHRLCSEFNILKQILDDAAISIYTLASETQQLLKDETEAKRQNSVLNLSTVLKNANINNTKAMELGVGINESYVKELENDPLLQEANSFRNEVLKNDVIELGSKMLYRNWLATMESIFEKISDDCSGFDDCLKYTFDSLSEMIETGPSRTKKLRTQIEDVERKFFNLTRKTDMSINDAVHISRGILQILKSMTGAEDVCAQAPNITEHPASFTELTVNENLVLRCTATGDFLVYQWRFNGEILKNQTSNILRINRVSKQNSGNYSCHVSNHVAEVTSILASVVVGSIPSIVSHPPSHRIVILSEYDSIHCQVKKDDYEVTYQWYFKSYKSSSYIMLLNERFSYLNFAPAKTDHQGWYYCKVSNKFGHTISKKSFIEVLKYSLPVPAAKVSLTVMSISRGSNTSTLHQEALAKVLASRFPPTNNSTPLRKDRIQELSLKDCKFFTQGGGLESTAICDWTFVSIGENITSAKTLSYNISEQNKRKISAALKQKNLIGQLSNETSAKGIAFSIGKISYSVSSLDISAMYFVCPKRQILITHVYKCVDCPRGYYGTLVNGIATCRICPRNTYQPEPGKTSCIKCPEGSINTNQGAYDQKECKDQSKYFISLLLINDHHGNVIVTTSVSGQVEIDNLKPKATVLKRMKWVTKKLVTVSAVKASTNESVNINGQPVIHLEPTSKELTSIKFLRIKAPKGEEPTTEYIDPFFPFLPEIVTPTTPVTTKKPDLKTFLVIIVVKNHYNNDVEVRINISGKLEDYTVKADATLTISKSWETKKMLSITAVNAATKQSLNINGQFVIHLQSETLTSRNFRLNVLNIGGKTQQ